MSRDRPGAKSSGFFERRQFEAVRAALPLAMQPVTTVAYHTGWRVPSEILPLEWARVDREHQLFRLDAGSTKNSEGRTFPYGTLPELRQVIDAQWAETKRLEKEKGIICPWVFHDDKGESFLGRGNVCNDQFRTAWRKACIAAGCPERIPHDFRRTAVRNLVRAGVPEKTAMQLTGHKTRSVFDWYDIVNEADLESAVSRLATATGAEKGQSGTSGRVRQFSKGSK